MTAAAPAARPTEAVPFRITPAQVPRLFGDWIASSTPLGSAPTIKRTEATFLPFYCFLADAYVPGAGHPFLFAGPAFQVYAGKALPRPFTRVLSNSLDAAERFHQGLLQLPGGGPVDVEPFAAYASTAWGVARAAAVAHFSELYPSSGAQVSFTGIEAFRVFMPAYVVYYSYLGAELRVFINGHTGDVFGMTAGPLIPPKLRAMFGGKGASGGSGDDASPSPLSFERAKQVGDVLGRILRIDPRALIVLGQGIVRLIFWPPFLMASLGSIAAYGVYRLAQPLLRHRMAFWEWEETRAKEAAEEATKTDDWQFRPRGESARDRARERRAAASGTSGTSGSSPHAEAHRASTSGRRSQAGAYANSSGGASGAGAARGGGVTYRPLPPVDETDLYALLEIDTRQVAPRDVSVAEVKAAFRRVLMKYHPDHQGGGGGEVGYGPPDACSSRTQAIIAAYGTLRDPGKKATYDASYRARRR